MTQTDAVVSPRSFKHHTPIFYLISIVLGVLSGYSEVTALHSLGHVIADVFIRLFKCVSLPVISLSILVTLSNYQTGSGMQYVWRRTLFYTLSTTFIAASVSFCLYLLLQPATPDFIAVNAAIALPTHETGGYLNHLLNLVPSNFLSPFLRDDQVISVLLLGIVIGIGVRFIPDYDARESMKQWFKGLHGLLIVLIRWIVCIIPVGLYGFITTTILQLKGGMALKGIGTYLLVIVLANLIQGFIILPLWLRSHGVNPFKAMRAMSPALSLAFFSKSSVGTLGVTMDTAEKRFGIHPHISRSVFPLCTSINMNGCAAFIFTTVIYLMQSHGVVLHIPMMMLWVLISTIAAIGNAGVPMGCFFLSASLLSSMNIPINLLGIILPFYTLIDMLETSLNVWSDACVVKIVNQHAELN